MQDRKGKVKGRLWRRKYLHYPGQLPALYTVDLSVQV